MNPQTNGSPHPYVGIVLSIGQIVIGVALSVSGVSLALYGNPLYKEPLLRTILFGIGVIFIPMGFFIFDWGMNDLKGFLRAGRNDMMGPL